MQRKNYPILRNQKEILCSMIVEETKKLYFSVCEAIQCNAINMSLEKHFIRKSAAHYIENLLNFKVKLFFNHI